MTVDLDAKVNRGDGTMQTPFALVPEGDIDAGNPILMEFTGKVEIRGDEDDNLQIELMWVDDPNAKSSVFCKLSDQKGLTKLIDLIASSGVEKKIQKIKPDFSVDNLTGRTLIHPGFHDQLKNCLPGCRVHATVKHAKGKNKEGQETTYANINKIAAILRAVAGQVGAVQTANAVPSSKPATVESW